MTGRILTHPAPYITLAAATVCTWAASIAATHGPDLAVTLLGVLMLTTSAITGWSHPSRRPRRVAPAAAPVAGSAAGAGAPAYRLGRARPYTSRDTLVLPGLDLHPVGEVRVDAPAARRVASTADARGTAPHPPAWGRMWGAAPQNSRGDASAAGRVQPTPPISPAGPVTSPLSPKE